MPVLDRPLLTAEELADLLQIPLQSAWQLGREGALRGAVVRIGTRMRFRRDDVEAFLAGRST
jgi:excisionase family DNA binding protein